METLQKYCVRVLDVGTYRYRMAKIQFFQVSTTYKYTNRYVYFQSLYPNEQQVEKQIRIRPWWWTNTISQYSGSLNIKLV